METVKWVIDPAHSEIAFRVKHLMISKVNGYFSSFEGTIDGEDFTKAKLSASIAATSISTRVTDRDNHLKSADFFDVENYPSLSFESTSLSKIDDENYKLTGTLKIKDVSKEVTLDLVYGGEKQDPWGNTKLGFLATGTINRKDWGLNWNAALETGGIMVGEEVKIIADLQFLKQVS
ncbi:YceI family protein [Zunongwangia atlantica]|uniref:Lipid/polyisoprenoid-binding YceI-like domain-containing protein n=1 Tax=Zunongwangia atlantica 22II14-10F7 TaxID=1185767 RepID=A0A1Y1T9K1_9FLAO|nr:YceI family protein [Zunongwangia atlantica]ORL47073.1 hypothetical protein IIF7_03616 [Zunongwangia atlantica 22II14-10F7]